MPPKPCCHVADNLRPLPCDPAHPDREILVCVVCGCRQITLLADPGVFGLTGATL